MQADEVTFETAKQEAEKSLEAQIQAISGSGVADIAKLTNQVFDYTIVPFFL